jgi:hypothetical protein
MGKGGATTDSYITVVDRKRPVLDGYSLVYKEFNLINDSLVHLLLWYENPNYISRGHRIVILDFYKKIPQLNVHILRVSITTQNLTVLFKLP